MIHQKCASNCGHGDRFHLRMEPHMVVEDKVLSMVWLLNCKEWQECRNLKAALRPFHCFIFIFQKSHTGHPCPISWHDHCTAALSADPASLFSVNPSQLLPHHFFLCPFFASGWLWKLPISIAEAFYITKWNFFSYLVHLSTLGDVQPLLQELLPRRTRRTTGTEQRSRECSIHTQQTHLEMLITLHTQLLTSLNWTVTGALFSESQALLSLPSSQGEPAWHRLVLCCPSAPSHHLLHALPSTSWLARPCGTAMQWNHPKFKCFLSSFLWRTSTINIIFVF